jgi:hypothetical protein
MTGARTTPIQLAGMRNSVPTALRNARIPPHRNHNREATLLRRVDTPHLPLRHVLIHHLTAATQLQAAEAAVARRKVAVVRAAVAAHLVAAEAVAVVMVVAPHTAGINYSNL